MLDNIRHEVVGYGINRHVVGVFYKSGFMRCDRHRRLYERQGNEDGRLVTVSGNI